MGIDGITGRIADIQSRIIALQTQNAAKATQSQMTSTTTGGVPTSTTASGASFASYLQSAVAGNGGANSAAGATGTVGTAGTMTTAAGRTYQLNAKGIPTDLAAYGNGKIPPTALEKVGDTGHKLWAPAAESLTKLLGDAKQAGINIGITDSYRPYTEQVDLAKRKGLYSQGGLAAKPGTSEHGWGMATDLDLSPKALSWMQQNAGKYGFVNNVSRESWHWAYKPKAA